MASHNFGKLQDSVLSMCLLFSLSVIPTRGFRPMKGSGSMRFERSFFLWPVYARIGRFTHYQILTVSMTVYVQIVFGKSKICFHRYFGIYMKNITTVLPQTIPYFSSCHGLNR